MPQIMFQYFDRRGSMQLTKAPQNIKRKEGTCFETRAKEKLIASAKNASSKSYH